MCRSIKKCFAVMLALVVFVSGMSNMSLSTLADDTIQETTAVSEETTSEVSEKTIESVAEETSVEETTDTKENKTPAKEDATLAEEDATVWEESTKDVTAELGHAENPVEKIVDTPLKKAVRAVPQAQNDFRLSFSSLFRLVCENILFEIRINCIPYAVCFLT